MDRRKPLTGVVIRIHLLTSSLNNKLKNTKQHGLEQS